MEKGAAIILVQSIVKARESQKSYSGKFRQEIKPNYFFFPSARQKKYKKIIYIT
jgi:hypothetical protein